MKLKMIAYAMVLVFGSTLLLSMTSTQDSKPWKTPDKYMKMKAPKSTPETVKAGKELYAKFCKSCHGATGKGDGTKAASLKTKVNSFSEKSFKSVTDGDKYFRSFIGRDEMPNFEKKVPEEASRWAIIHYINTL
jgi:mono/diheme cytochrome c family protein